MPIHCGSGVVQGNIQRLTTGTAIIRALEWEVSSTSGAAEHDLFTRRRVDLDSGSALIDLDGGSAMIESGYHYPAINVERLRGPCQRRGPSDRQLPAQRAAAPGGRDYGPRRPLYTARAEVHARRWYPWRRRGRTVPRTNWRAAVHGRHTMRCCAHPTT